LAIMCQVKVVTALGQQGAVHGALQVALMLDSAAEAQQLCLMHGFETSAQDGVPVALLVKVRTC